MQQHNFLVLGGGGREHALAWKLAASPLTAKVYCAPGNAGTAIEARVTNVPLKLHDFKAVAEFMSEQQIAACVVGPELPLVSGLADYLQQQGHYCFGPTAAAAKLEASKLFCKQFLARHKIPTAAYREFSEFAAAVSYLKEVRFPQVIKFDGLAGGKGVTVAADLATATAALKDIYERQKFGTTAEPPVVIIEECLRGEEVSCMLVVKGSEFSIMQTSMDYKPRNDDGRGPNTGGMGAYAPAILSSTGRRLSPLLTELIRTAVVAPTIRGLAADGIDYNGFLYAGLMLKDGWRAQPPEVWVLEYNCRLGDPETQPLLFSLGSDLAEFVLNCREGQLDDLAWHPGCALGVVMVSDGYPNDYKTGVQLPALAAAAENYADLKVFHSGTELASAGRLVTAGGRVLTVTAKGKELPAVRQVAYDRVRQLAWPGCHYRKDIGKL